MGAKTKKPSVFRQFIKVFLWFQVLILSGIVVLTLFFVGVANGLLGPMPSIEEIQNPVHLESSSIYSAEYELMGTFYVENRLEVPYEEISPHLVNALIATEDKRFYTHAGIDFLGLARAIIKTGILGQDAGGGSTISQQTAKMLFHDPDYSSRARRVMQKIKEWVLAIQLERNFTKEEMTALYFNTMDFIYQSHGIKTAARTYFNKLPSEISPEEAAVLVGMLKSPVVYNPKFKYDNALNRRNVVLNLMAQESFISSSARDSLKALPITLNYQSNDHRLGLAPYFREQVRQYLLNDFVKQYKKPNGEPYNIYTDGLKIYTTLNADMQRYAEEAVEEHLSALQKQFFAEWKGKDPWLHGSRTNPELITNTVTNSRRFQSLLDNGFSEDEAWDVFNKPVPMQIFSWKGDLDTVMSPVDSIKHYKQILQVGFIAMDPQTGYIRAWVGGANFWYFQLDHAGNSTKRQVGSTIKPLLYALSVEQNSKRPCDKLPYEAPNIKGFESWNPRGTGKWPEGSLVPIKEGLQHSDNRVTAHIIKELGYENFIRFCQNELEINSYFEPGPAVCLGTSDISLLDMMEAYSMFGNLGVKSKPMWLLRIEDKNGVPIVHDQKPLRVEKLTPESAYTTNLMMQQVVKAGTARRMIFRYGLKNEIAGKTGTTQGGADGWFIGVAPELMAGAWVGCDDPSVTFATSSSGQGANMALPIWALFFQKVYADKNLKIDGNATFTKPPNYDVIFDCSLYDNPYQ